MLIKISSKLILLAIFLLGLSFYSCGGGDGGDDNNGNDNPQQPSVSAPFAEFGSIRGSVKSASGQALNAVHVRAVNIANTNIQISSFSGVTTNKSIVNGFFQIDRLPPGNYRVLIERLDGRSGVFSDTIYSDYVEDQNPFIAFPDEYFNGNEESSTDDPGDFVTVNVSAGEITTGIDFITNN